jgi:hypothetical protein
VRARRSRKSAIASSGTRSEKVSGCISHRSS